MRIFNLYTNRFSIKLQLKNLLNNASNQIMFNFVEQSRTNRAYILTESIHGMFSCHTIAEKVELYFSPSLYSHWLISVPQFPRQLIFVLKLPFLSFHHHTRLVTTADHRTLIRGIHRLSYPQSSPFMVHSSPQLSLLTD